MKKSLAVLLVVIMIVLPLGRVRIVNAKEKFTVQGDFYDMAQKDNKFVAVGLDGVIAVSEDFGDNWSRIEPFCNSTIRQVIWAKDKFIAVNLGGEIYSSSDGYKWDLNYGKPVNSLLDLCWNGKQYIAVGSYGHILISMDGLEWKPVKTGHQKTLYSIEWNGEYFVMVGEQGYSAISYDGLSWDEYSTGSTGDLVNVTWVNNRFYSMGDRGLLLSSEDGKSWEIVRTNTNATLWDLIWNGNEYVVLGCYDELKGIILGSKDGKTWGTIANDSGMGYHCGIFTEEKYVLGGGGWGTGSLIKVTLSDISIISDEKPTESKGEEIPLDTVVKYKEIEAGRAFTFAIDDQGNVWSWGNNEQGTLGNNNFEDQVSPVKVLGLNNVVAVSSGILHVLALTSDGKVYSWGGNRDGQLGDGTYTNKNTATLVEGLNDVVAISAGGEFSIALKKDGTVWGWGRNSSGELGINDMTNNLYKNYNKPVQISGLTDVVAIAASKYYSIALKKDNSVWAWGIKFWDDDDGETINLDHSGAQKLNIENIKAIDAGSGFSVLLTKSGDVFTFGSNDYGQLGNGKINSNYFRSTSLNQVKGISNVESINAGSSYIIVKKTDGSYWGWGDNIILTESQVDKITSPIKIEFKSAKEIGNIKSIACGPTHMAILQEDGTIKIKGLNIDGELGLGHKTHSSIFMDIAKPSLYSFSPNLKTKMSSWATTPIDLLWTQGFINQDLLDEFKKPVTRGEFAGLVTYYYEMEMDVTVLPSNKNPFKDIANHKYEDSIIKAYELGIIRGTSPDTFQPDLTITRQEIAVMLYNLMKVVNLDHVTLVNEQKFIDNGQIAKWAKQPVNLLYAKNIMAGVAHMEISPLTNVTREQALVFLSRFVEIAKFSPGH